MKYQPLADRVIVEPAQDNRVSRGGIVMPDIVQSHRLLAFGTVVSHGNGRVNAEGLCVPLTVKVGDVVAYPRREAQAIPLLRDDGSELELLMLREGQIVAIVHDLPKATSLVDVAGAPLSMMPSSRGLPDVVYENRDAMDRSAADLRAVNAPADVLAELEDIADEPYEH